MKGNITRAAEYDEKLFKEYYSKDYLHECIASDNRRMRAQALKKAKARQGVHLYTLNDSFGGLVLMQIDYDGRETKLLSGFRSFETEDIGDNVILTTHSVEESCGFGYSVIVGNNDGFKVAATDLDIIYKDELVDEYRKMFENPPEYCEEEHKMLIMTIKSFKDLEKI
ncbi:MAG: hypothetical protein LBN07_00455 [Christensenellaceae bacterium]|jgi:hypothetical protein|nr:hypothetical protein [Christensenellaceae bacterium]